MKRLCGMLLLLVPLGVCVGVAVLAADPPADKKAEAIQVIDRALAARGGDEKTLALPAFQAKSTGKLYRSGIVVPYEAEIAFHYPDRCNFRLTLDPVGSKIPLTIVYDKGQAWEKLGDTLKEKTKEQAADLG